MLQQAAVEKCKQLPQVADDDDSWLSISVDDLDEKLKARTTTLSDSSDEDDDDDDDDDDADEDEAAKQKTTAQREAVTKAQREIDAMTKTFSSFLGKSSSFEGAEFPHDDDVEDDGDDDDDDDDGEVDFDMQKFMQALQGVAAKLGDLVCRYRRHLSL